jgi:hypothetical protein
MVEIFCFLHCGIVLLLEALIVATGAELTS